MGLVHEGGLAVQADNVRERGERRRRVALHRRRIAVEAIVQAEPEFVQRKVGADPIGRAGEAGCGRRIAGPQIFGAGGPVRRDRLLDPCTRGPADAKRIGGFNGSARQLRQHLPVMRPGQSAGGIKQPAAGRVADPAAHGAGRLHRLAEGRRAEQRRGERGNTANRQSGEIGKSREGGVGLDAKYQAVGQHEIVADLQSLEIASGVGKVIPWLEYSGRSDTGWQCGIHRCRGPVRAAEGIADMAADVEPGPVVAQRGDRRLYGVGGGKIGCRQWRGCVGQDKRDGRGQQRHRQPSIHIRRHGRG